MRIYRLFFLCFLFSFYFNGLLFFRGWEGSGEGGCRGVAPALAMMGYQGVLLLEFLLDALGQHGDDLVEVADDAQVSHAEDGGELVLVDGDDEVALLHTGEVLDGTADAASHVQVRTDGLTRLAHLYLVGHHAVVNHGT